MSGYGAVFTTKVDGNIDSYTLDYKMPSVIWSRVMQPGESLVESIPIIGLAENVQVFSTPLDYNYPTSTPYPVSTSKKGSITRDDLSRFYTVPQPHIAVLDKGLNTISIQPGIGEMSSVTAGLLVAPDLMHCRARSLVVVMGDVTVEDITQTYGFTEKYGMSDGTRTINQHYANFFLYEQQEIRTLTNPRRSSLGTASRGGSRTFYWDTAVDGTSSSALFDVVKVPLKCTIPTTKPAFVVIDSLTTSETSFVGFMSSNGLYTHACFLCPNLAINHKIRFSVMSTPSANGMQYVTATSQFSSNHAYHDKACGNKWGSIWCGATGMATINFASVSMYAKTDPESYGAIIKNGVGGTVFNSTMFVCDNPGLYAMDGLDLGVKNEGQSFRTTNKITGFIPYATRANYRRGLIGGTFSSMDLCFYQDNWRHDSKTGVWPAEWVDKFYTYIQQLGSVSPVVKMVNSVNGFGVYVTMGPTWQWLNKIGKLSSGFNGPIGIIIAVIGAVLMYFGFYQAGYALIQIGLQMDSMNVRDGSIGSASTYLYQEGTSNVYTLDSVDLLTKYNKSA